jgi:hypothetical protein
MAGFQKYEGAAEFYINNKLMAEATSLSITDSANDRPVNTMTGGFVGFSDGPQSAEASCSVAIPKAGYELDFRDALDKKKDLTIVHKSGGVRRTYLMRCQSVDTSQSTDSTAVLNARFAGRAIGQR